MNWWENERRKENARAKNSRKTRRLRATLKKLRRVRTWQLALILVLAVLVTMIFLRENNLGMIRAREALISADKTGDARAVSARAKDLQRYVSAHMNTYTGRISLQGMYNRATTDAINAAKPPEVDPGRYTAAQNDCLPTLHANGYRAWASCVAGEVGLGANSLDTDVEMPDAAAYYVDFASARWSLDAAGISLLISVTLTVAIFAKIVFTLTVKIILGIRTRRLKKT